MDRRPSVEITSLYWVEVGTVSRGCGLRLNPALKGRLKGKVYSGYWAVSLTPQDGIEGYDDDDDAFREVRSHSSNNFSIAKL
jgi:hypothetical protein